MEQNIRLAAVGDNCIDLYDQTGDAYPGGNPVNVAVYTVRLGGSASYTGVVGDDKYGGLMRQAVAAKGVDVSHLHTEPGSTALSHVTVVNGDRVFGDYEEGVMENFRLTEEDVDFLCGHDLVVSGLWGRVEGDLPRLKTRGGAGGLRLCQPAGGSGGGKGIALGGLRLFLQRLRRRQGVGGHPPRHPHQGAEARGGHPGRAGQPGL